MVEQNPDPAAKRQRLEAEQRVAFEEDMARVRAAMAAQNESEGVRPVQAEELAPEQGSHDQHIEPNIRHGSRADSDDEEGGNWLKNFTTHHTRVGEQYQVTDLPTPSSKK